MSEKNAVVAVYSSHEEAENGSQRNYSAPEST